MKFHLHPALLLIALAISSCSVEISQSPQATPSPEIILPPLPSTGTPFSSSRPTKEIPITWGDLNLSGKLVYTAAVVQKNKLFFNIESLDLANGVITTVFQVPEDGWIDAVTVSPDGKQMIISYSRPYNTPFGGRELLYSMPMDASQPPQLLFPPQVDPDQYFQPDWSPDGKYVYFTHITSQISPPYEIMRFSFADSGIEKLVEHAFQSRVSGDGTQIAFVSLGIDSYVNQLFLANSDGTDAHQVLLNITPEPFVIDSPIFSPDNQSILFSMPSGLQASSPSWLDTLLGITVAKANGALLSDWWSVPISGGNPTQLTHLLSSSLYASLSPDKNYYASYSANGIFVMKPDGTGVTMVVTNTGGIAGTVSWIP